MSELKVMDESEWVYVWGYEWGTLLEIQFSSCKLYFKFVSVDYSIINPYLIFHPFKFFKLSIFYNNFLSFRFQIFLWMQTLNQYFNKSRRIWVFQKYYKYYTVYIRCISFYYNFYFLFYFIIIIFFK